jgi:hypothetical protein
MKIRLIALLTLGFTARLLSQSTVSTMPATVPNNGLGAVTFEINANQPIYLTGMTNVFSYAAGNTGLVDIWYRVGGVLAAGQTTPVVARQTAGC